MDGVRELDIVRAVPVRSQPLRLERAEGDTAGGTLGRLTVRFSPYNTWYEIDSWWEGNFLERTVRGTFAKTIAENGTNVRVLFDHGHDFQIGNKVLTTPDDIREDPDSAVLEGELFDTSYNRDLEPGLRAGAYGSSFAFRVIQDQWNDEPGVSDHNPKGIPERTITEVRLFEAGPVTFPANPSATADLRSAMVSMTDTYYESMRSKDSTLTDMLERSRALRVKAAAPGTAVTPGAATSTTREPLRHSTRYGVARRREILYPHLIGDQK